MLICIVDVSLVTIHLARDLRDLFTLGSFRTRHTAAMLA